MVESDAAFCEYLAAFSARIGEVEDVDRLDLLAEAVAVLGLGVGGGAGCGGGDLDVGDLALLIAAVEVPAAGRGVPGADALIAVGRDLSGGGAAGPCEHGVAEEERGVVVADAAALIGDGAGSVMLGDAALAVHGVVGIGRALGAAIAAEI